MVTVGLDRCPVTGESGLTCLPDVAACDLDDQEVDSLLLPGCLDILALDNQPVSVAAVARLARQAAVIGAISSSPLLLAKTGVLQDRRYTVGLRAEDRIAAGCFDEAKYSDELLVLDGTLITARGSAFVEFGRQLGTALGLDVDPSWYGDRPRHERGEQPAAPN